jgi:hypothetical protein
MSATPRTPQSVRKAVESALALAVHAKGGLHRAREHLAKAALGKEGARIAMRYESALTRVLLAEQAAALAAQELRYFVDLLDSPRRMETVILEANRDVPTDA